jgi:hypothetical protein
MSVLVDEVAHASQMRGITFERFGDGALKGGGAVGVKQLDESAGEHAEVLTALGGGEEQCLSAGCGVVESVLCAVLAALSFVFEECLDVSGFFNLLIPVEGAGVSSEDALAIEHAHGVECSEHDEGALDAVVGDGVIVLVESHVRGLGDVDLDTLLTREGIVGQCEERWSFFVEDLSHTSLAVLWTRAFVGAGATPLIGLGVEVFDITKVAGAEEAVAYKTDRSLDASLLVPPRRRHGAGFEAVMGGEFEQGWMEADSVASAFEDDALHVVIEDLPDTSAEHRERLDMAAHEVREGCVEVEAQERVSRVAQDHDEGHQGALGAPDGEFSEVCPIDLGLLARQGAKAQIRFAVTPRA